jgi:diguanylate cyclase (GGDEF)-like protein
LPDNYKEMYELLYKDYESYQFMAEKTMQNLNQRISELEKKLDKLTGIVEVSRYINLYMNDDNLIHMINDMLIGVIGVTECTFYLMKNDKLEVQMMNLRQCKGCNCTSKVCSERHRCNQKHNLIRIHKRQSFVLNSETPIFTGEGQTIHSVLGIPIEIKGNLIGYTLLEHTLYNFFNKEHEIFLQALTNQIAVTLENNRLYQQIVGNASKDPLLGINNRRYFFETMQKKIVDNPNNEFAIVMLDIDHFKKVNDAYGHVFGDETLKTISNIILENIDSANDILARYGGEEFVLCIRNIKNIESLYRKIDNIRMKICESLIEFEGKVSKVTASFGVSIYPYDASNLEYTLEVADRRLYEAKRTGRNKVVIA